MMRSTPFRAALLGGAMALLSGCGGSDGRVAVSGSVSVDGTPVESGSIVFVPSEAGKDRATGEIKDGKYNITAERGPLPGGHRVEILANKKTGKKVGVPGDPGQTTDEVKQVLPAKYNVSTTLNVEIKSSGNSAVDFTNLSTK